MSVCNWFWFVLLVARFNVDIAQCIVISCYVRVNSTWAKM